jgi:ribosomal protein L5
MAGDAAEATNVMKAVRGDGAASATALCVASAEQRALGLTVQPQIKVHKLVLNISVGESGDRLTKAAKVRANTQPRLGYWQAGVA